MIFIGTPLKGAYVIEIEPIEAERGFSPKPTKPTRQTK